MQIIKKSDVAIGSLALHRNNMNEACPLKTREYLKYGLPTIIGYIDSDFIDADAPFLLKLTNEEESIKKGLSSIKQFIYDSRSITIQKSDVQHIFNDYKEKKRLEFMTKLFDKS
ncbi:hypothetical protein ACFFIX_12650 [Metabacillus herbersteinensis]|uniref:Glycosyltransferase n=1 Tax=Metabacillus herbersteinensis TaxID=283816 RepID=A0ABV6GF39_9BACI